jgi:hypothetical protein
MYAMTLSLRSVVRMNIGMPAWGVVSATNKAVAVIPGVVASSTNVGDFEFGERTCPFWIA